MANYIVSDTNLTAVADAIRTKGGTSAALEFPQGFVDAIDDIETGGGGGDEPVPEDGKTRLWIHIDEDTPANHLTFYVRFTSSVANNVTIDWGDGTTETKGSTTATNYPHTYAQGGDYVIALTVNSGTISFDGSTSNSIYGSNGNQYAYNRSRIQRVIIGDDVTSIGDYVFRSCYALRSVTMPNGITRIGAAAFSNCHTLRSVTIPDSITSIGGDAFQYCYALMPITIPDNVTSIGNYAFQYCCAFDSIIIPDNVTKIGTYTFQYCYVLKSITIPDNVTRIDNYAFASCVTLRSITIPDNVTKIGTYAFQYCYSMSEYHLKPTIPPTLANTNVFTGIPTDCIIYVPYSEDHSILEAYKTATNWSTYASYMQEEPQ